LEAKQERGTAKSKKLTRKGRRRAEGGNAKKNTNGVLPTKSQVNQERVRGGGEKKWDQKPFKFEKSRERRGFNSSSSGGKKNNRDRGETGNILKTGDALKRTARWERTVLGPSKETKHHRLGGELLHIGKKKRHRILGSVKKLEGCCWERFWKRCGMLVLKVTMHV